MWEQPFVGTMNCRLERDWMNVEMREHVKRVRCTLSVDSIHGHDVLSIWHVLMSKRGKLGNPATFYLGANSHAKMCRFVQIWPGLTDAICLCHRRVAQRQNCMNESATKNDLCASLRKWPDFVCNRACNINSHVAPSSPDQEQGINVSNFTENDVLVMSDDKATVVCALQ